MSAILPSEGVFCENLKRISILGASRLCWKFAAHSTGSLVSRYAAAKNSYASKRIFTSVQLRAFCRLNISEYLIKWWIYTGYP